MIIEALVSVLFAVVGVIFTLLGVIPDMPQAITDVLDVVQAYAVSGIAIIFGMLGKTFTMAVLTSIMLLILHQQLFNIITWVYHKIRG
jgi:ABC-type transport system involved in multi-copper enzyme maturation permease subunit